MKKLLIIAIISSMSTLSFAQYGHGIVEERNTVDVTGNYLLRVDPDRFILQIIIDEAQSKGKIDLDQMERAMKSALDALEVDTKKDLRLVSSASDAKKRNMISKKEYALTAYTNQGVRAIFDSLEKVGVTSIRIEKTTHSQMDKKQAEARKEAMHDAQIKAKELASAVRQSIGNAVFIRDNTNTDYGNEVVMFRAAKMNAAPQEPVEIDAKPIEIRYNVFVKFELK